MESHIVATVAGAHGLPVTEIRVIIDPAERALTRAAVVSHCSNGAVDLAALMCLAVEYPAELPGLLRTALYALRAGIALGRRRRILRSYIVLADGGEEALSVENALSKSLEVTKAVSRDVLPQAWMMGGAL